MRKRDKKDEEHKNYISQQRCLICGDPTSTECAHVRMADARVAKPITGMGTKPADCWTVPLCSMHHRQQHECGEAGFWRYYGIDPVFKAMALWINSGDIEAGETVCKLPSSDERRWAMYEMRAAKERRDSIIEECAKVAEEYGGIFAPIVAKRIRALRDKS